MTNIYTFFFTIYFLGGYIQQNNFIKNGDFSGEPSFIHWYSETGLISKKLGGHPGGYAWLNHEGLPASDPDITQKIKGLEIDGLYIIRGDYKGGDNAPVHYNYPGDTVFAIDINQVELATFPMPDPVSKWTPFEVSFVATDTVQVLRFRGEINGTDGDVAIDNIVLMKNE